MKNNIFKKDGFFSISSSILSVAIGLFVGFILLLASNPSQALEGAKTILLGGFNAGTMGIGQVLYGATPIILTGLSVGFAFKTGLFNIGASGQMIVGAFVAVYVSLKWTFIPDSMVLIVALIMSIIAGGLWALIPGILKTYCNVSEVISTIMMNYIGMYTVNYLVSKTIFDSLRNQSITPPSYAVLPKWGLDKLFPGSSINCGIFIAIAVVILLYIILNKTTFGYELTACGFNKDASEYAGINSKKNIILSMVIAGAIAGLAGGVLFLSGTGKHIEVVDLLAPEGLMGIPVALLGASNPIGILLSGLFISYINVGGFYLQALNYPPQIIDIIISLIIYFTAFSSILKNVVKFIVTKISPRKHEMDKTTISDKGGE
ncbi:MAG: ABC transporter permease [Oscillospiraceae bacterium]